MSKQSWLDEFYPTDAETAGNWTNLECVRHSLQKWRGLTAESLAKHDVVNRSGEVFAPQNGDLNRGKTVIIISGASCSLCVKHFNSDDWAMSARERCKSCPLARARGGAPCDRASRADKVVDIFGQDEKISPWRLWYNLRDPSAMIAALEKAEARLVAESNRKR